MLGSVMVLTIGHMFRDLGIISQGQTLAPPKPFRLDLMCQSKGRFERQSS